MKLKDLFHYGPGNKVPFVLRPGFQRGYVQMLVQALSVAQIELPPALAAV